MMTKTIQAASLGRMVAILLATTCYIALVRRSFGAQATTNNNNEQISIMMPDIRPDHAEQYLCKAYRVRKDQDGQFIVGFNPQADAHRVHHMLMYGCERPGIFQRDSPNFVWDCSEMHASSQALDDENSLMGQSLPISSSYEEGPVCHASGKQQILYGWALDAPSLKLPHGVGFKIGGLDSGIEFLVLQVHYGHYDMFKRLPSLTDNSGLILDVRRNNENSGITRRAGVLLLFSLGYVPMGKNKHEIWCEIEDDIEIHPFRFRVHTHKLGTQVKGVKIGRHQNDQLGFDVDKATLIGAGNPQQPQMFYPVQDSNMTLSKGDKVYATCEFNNMKDHDVKIGQTGDDEMCNFYMMYWTDSKSLLTNNQCTGYNPPQSYLSSLVDRYAGLF
jgi:peptidylglycine monooxygenase